MFQEIPKNCRYGYVRVSSKSQEKNSSLEAQKKELIKEGLIDFTSKMDNQRLYIYMSKIKDHQFYYYNKEKKSNKYTYDRFIDVLNIKSKHTLKHINTLVKHKLLIVSNVETTIKHIFRTQNRYYVIEFKKADTNDNNVSN